MVLTKAGSILGPIATVLGYVMDILFRFTSSFGVFNVGLCIILFTIVMKTLMIPLTIKQQKTTKLMSVMNPEIQAIQKKYKGKSDQESMQRQNVEIQAVYEKYGTSMTGGCLPLLIQMPILLALYRVIYNIPAYVPSVRVYFDNVVTPLMGQADYAQKLQEITNIATACGGKLDKFDFTNANRLVDMLYKFSTSQWGELQLLFPAISDVIGQNAAVVERMNTFLGLNMAEAPGWVPSFAWIIPVLAAVSQWFSTKLMSGNQPSTSADAENPEEIFQFFDWLSTKEGQIIAQYGAEGVSYTMEDGYPRLTDEVAEKLNDGDTDYLINTIGAGFGGSGNYFFEFVLTNKNNKDNFGESRPGASSGNSTFARSVQIAEDYPVEKKLVPGLDATAYMSADELADVKTQMDLLDWDETFVQACFAKSDDEVKTIIESFRDQLKAAGIDRFEKYVKDVYEEDPDSVSFYD